jgi:hypothetical protein
MSRKDAIDQAAGYFDSGLLQSELAALIAYRSESQNSDRFDVLEQYLVDGV